MATDDIKKIEMKTENLAKENVEKIAALFPNCITEKKDTEGKTTKCINFDVLRQMLTEEAIAGSESYEFTWVGKNDCIVKANTPIEKTLRPCPEESVNWDTTENLYIEGDNLDALKLLQKAYLGKVKMIYIDPPYNRKKGNGKNLIYNDNLKWSNDEWDIYSQSKDEDGNRLFNNTKANGRFHSDWCSMIYSRLLVTRNLLSDDGIILISIDDDELQNMINICNDIFGEDNKIANIVVTSNSSKNNSDFMSIIHEYLLCYAKNKSLTPINWKVKRNNTKEYVKRAKLLVKNKLSNDEIHKELNILTKYPRFYDFDHFTCADKKGIYQTSDLTAPDSKNRYDIIHPVTKKVCSCGTRGWAYSEENMKQLISEGKIEFGDDENTIPRLKNYLFEDDNLLTVPKSVVFFDSQGSTKWIKQQDFDFDYPKSVDFIKWVISLYPNKDLTIMDYFSGSSTTADAVMRLNLEDGGRRKFIMVQYPEKCDVKSMSYSENYDKITEIGKKRIKNAGDELVSSIGVSEDTTDVGFRVLKIDDWNRKDVARTAEDTNQEDLQKYVDNIVPERSDLDLLFGCLVEEGLELTKPIKKDIIDGVDIYTYNDWLISCFAKNVPESVIKKIAERKPRKAIFRDSSFADSPAKINVVEIFKMISPGTSVGVI